MGRALNWCSTNVHRKKKNGKESKREQLKSFVTTARLYFLLILLWGITSIYQLIIYNRKSSCFAIILSVLSCFVFLRCSASVPALFLSKWVIFLIWTCDSSHTAEWLCPGNVCTAVFISALSSAEWRFNQPTWLDSSLSHCAPSESFVRSGNSCFNSIHLFFN